MTPTTRVDYSRDDFPASRPESIRLTDEIPTANCSAALISRGMKRSMPQLERLAREWLKRLAASSEDANTRGSGRGSVRRSR